MVVYLLVMAIILVLAYPLVERKPSNAKKLIFVAVTFTAMLAVSVFRYGVGNDYFSYIHIFKNMNDRSWLDILTMNCEFEPGFMIINKLIRLFTDSTEIMFAVYAFIILAPIGYVIYKRSENVWISSMLFISLTFFYCTLSFIRQSMAFAIIFLSYKFITKNNYFMVLLLTFIACLFHTSAIIFIPVYLFSIIVKPTKISVPIYFAVLALIYLFSTNVLELAVSVLPQYKYYLNLSYIKNGYSFVYIILPSILLLISLAAHFTSFGKARPKYSAIMTNFAFVNFAIWFISTKHFIIERFDMYNAIFMILYLPAVVMHYKERFLEYYKWKKTAEKGALYVPSPIKNSELTEEDNLQRDAAENSDASTDEKLQDSDDIKVPATEVKRININPAVPYFAVLGLIVASNLWYNWFGLTVSVKGFHGVVPYKSIIPAYMDWSVKNESLGGANCPINTEKSLLAYIYKIRNNNYTAVFSNKSDFVSGLNSDICGAFNAIGLDKFTKADIDNNYIAVVKDGNVVYEEISENILRYSYDICDSKLEIMSDSIASSILLDGKETSLNKPGMNILVLDSSTGEVIDSVNFKTSYIMLTANR